MSVVPKPNDMITVRAHDKKTGELTVMRVPKGTPMKEVMNKYAEAKGVRVERLSWKRRSSVVAAVPSPSHKVLVDDECVDCGCSVYM